MPMPSGRNWGMPASNRSFAGEATGKKEIRHDRRRDKERWRVEATSDRLDDFRRVTTRDDDLARTFLDTGVDTINDMFLM